MEEAIARLDLMNMETFAGSIPDVEDASPPKQIATIKAEVKSNSNGSSVTIKEGQQYFDYLTPMTQEELRHAFIQEFKEGRGIDSKKVLDVIDSAKKFLELCEPTVKDMRSGIPKAVQVLYHLNETLQGSSKIKNIWAVDHKPYDWPRNIPFEDPNNGQKKKTDKLKKASLVIMYQHLQTEYQAKKELIMREKDNYIKNLPKQSKPIGQTPQEQYLALVFQRTDAMLQEFVGNSTTGENIRKYMDKLLVWCGEGEDVRKVFGAFCNAVQGCIIQANLTDQMNIANLKNNLAEIYEQFKDNSVQAVSDDTGKLCTTMIGATVQGQGDQVLLPSPSMGFNHMAAPPPPQQQQHQQQHMWQQQPMPQEQPSQDSFQQPQPQQQVLPSPGQDWKYLNPQQQQQQQQEQQLQQPQQEQAQEQQPQEQQLQPLANQQLLPSAGQEWNCPIPQQQQQEQHRKTDTLMSMDYGFNEPQPNTQLSNMQHSNNYYDSQQTVADNNFITNVMAPIVPIQGVTLGKRKYTEDGEIISNISSPPDGKTFTLLQAQPPSTDILTQDQLLDQLLSQHNPVNSNSITVDAVSLQDANALEQFLQKQNYISADQDWAVNSMEVDP